MGRKKIHADAQARRVAYLADKMRFDLILTTRIGNTVNDLAAQYETSTSQVLNDLIRYALTNRDWKGQGLLWHDVTR
jgi:hypothetical protein